MKVVGVTKICAFAELNRLTSTLKALPRTTPIRRALPFRGLTNAELRATSLFCFSHLSHGQEYKPCVMKIPSCNFGSVGPAHRS